MDRSRRRGSSGRDTRHSHALRSPPLSSSPLAEQSLARDIATFSDEDVDGAQVEDTQSDTERARTHGSYRRLSGVAYGSSRPVLSSQHGADSTFESLSRKQSHDAERSLLRDNHLLPPKHKEKSQSFLPRLYRRLFSTKVPIKNKSLDRDLEGNRTNGHAPTETSPLLNGNGGAHGLPDDDSEVVDEQWERAVLAGDIHTTWQREAKTLTAYCAPLIVTFFLQYSITVVSIFAVGHIGKMELGAVSLANMTMSVVCLAPFQGLATSLDTLCAQAYGSGHKHLVGIQFQRMVCFLMCLAVPVAIFFVFAEDVLKLMIPEAESARLAGLYLRVMLFAIPGIVLFECGKRFTQAQGLFRATTYVLLIVSPINVFINWLLVWKLKMGFIGAPIAVAVSETLLPILLLGYVVFIDGSQCWGGFSKRAFTNWWSMIRLALPGMIMVEAEWLAFEIITLMSSRFGPEYLAAQSVIATLSTITFQIPFPMSIAASTRIANLIGAGLPEAAKVSAKVTFVMVMIVGVINAIVYGTARYHLPLLFTSDPDVIVLIAQILPIIGGMQVFDSLGASAHGILRGIGKQSIGGPANLIAYYVISLPAGIGMAFGLGWKLAGFWVGVVIGLVAVSIIEYAYIIWTDWSKAADEARARNEAG